MISWPGQLPFIPELLFKEKNFWGGGNTLYMLFTDFGWSIWKRFFLQISQSVNNIHVCGEWFEPRGISYLVGVIVRVKVVFRKTVVVD